MTVLMTQFKEPVAGVLASAEACFASWRSKTISERGSVVAAATGALYGRREAFAGLLSIERVQRIDQSAADVDLSIDIMDYCAKSSLGLCAESHLASNSFEKRIGREAQGVVVHSQPSRFLFFDLARFVALNLIKGNVVVLTHAAESPRCTVAFEHLWLEAGAPVGAFTNVAGGSRRALGSIDEVDDRFASIHGGAGAREVRISHEAGQRPPGLDALRQSA